MSHCGHESSSMENRMLIDISAYSIRVYGGQKGGSPQPPDRFGRRLFLEATTATFRKGRI